MKRKWNLLIRKASKLKLGYMKQRVESEGSFRPRLIRLVLSLDESGKARISPAGRREIILTFRDRDVKENFTIPYYALF